MPIPAQVAGPSYKGNEFTDSQLVLREEYIPNTQYSPTVIEFLLEVVGVMGSSTSDPTTSATITTSVETVRVAPAVLTCIDNKPYGVTTM